MKTLQCAEVVFEYPESPRQCERCRELGPIRLAIVPATEGVLVADVCECGGLVVQAGPYASLDAALAARASLDQYGLLPDELRGPFERGRRW